MSNDVSNGTLGNGLIVSNGSGGLSNGLSNLSNGCVQWGTL